MAIATDTLRPKTVPLIAKKKPFRADVQGLRMIAVVAVILDHLFGWPSGGFVGVDVFFVISGFLITGMLLREHEKTGRISFTGFYKRRVKRILPASTVALVVTVAASYLVFGAVRFQETVTDGIWSLFFGANWRFATVGTDYFQADGPVSPLQHFWSLAVEEQFYFVWPWVMLAIFALGAKMFGASHSQARGVVGLVLILVTAASFTWAAWETATNPNMAYFSTFSRTWELGLGAIIAVFAPELARLPHLLRPFLAWAGLAAIAISFFVITAESAFPAPWAVLPVLGTALVIASGTGGHRKFLWPITNRASTYIGDLSYSLYLWHFPVIVLLGVLMPSGLAFYVTAAVLMSVLAVLSYYLVEDPIRKGPWLSGLPPHEREALRRKAKARREAYTKSPVFKMSGLVVLFAVTSALVVAAILPQPLPVSARPAPSPIATGEAAAEQETPEGALSSQVISAANASEWPELTPALGEITADARASEWAQDHCLAGESVSDDDFRDTVKRCVYGTGEKNAVIFGDSIGLSYAPGVRAALGEGWSVHIMTMQQCPSVEVPVERLDGVRDPECAEFREWATSEISAMAPDLLILSNAENTIDRLTSGKTGAEAVTEWGAATTKTVTTLSASAKNVVTIAPPPAGVRITDCATPLSSPKDCVTEPKDAYRALVAGERKAVESAGGTYLSVQSWFCTSAGTCPSFIDNIPVRVDSNHLTNAYATSLGDVLRDKLPAM